MEYSLAWLLCREVKAVVRYLGILRNSWFWVPGEGLFAKRAARGYFL
jgi:hypothetical protein